MSIVCGTDFSEMAAHAATAAGCLAARTGQTIHLVHALDIAPHAVHEQPGHPLMLWAESRLGTEAERLRGLGATVQAHAVAGPADSLLQTIAHDVTAQLIVVGAVGQHGNESRKLGSRADRTAEKSRRPVLTVRDSAPFVAWFGEARPLRVVMGIDESESAENAARWLDGLCRLGAVEVTLAHLYWPPEAMYRLGLEGIRSFVEPDPELVKTLEQQFSKRFDGLLHAKSRMYRIEPHMGRVGDGLAALAAETKADLLVLGCRGVGPLQRFWDGSTARHALNVAQMSVACVPPPEGVRGLHVPRLRQVLVATDFSELGNGAIPLAYAAAGTGATIHLIHVIKSGRLGIDPYDIFHPTPDQTTAEATLGARSRLSELIPADASGKGVTTQIHVLEANDPSEVICQAAERLSVDLICLGTHGRTGLAKAALGSVAARVLTHSRRPLLLARRQRP
jgi:nucleotide-binding universal stress UspA family protein